MGVNNVAGSHNAAGVASAQSLVDDDDDASFVAVVCAQNQVHVSLARLARMYHGEVYDGIAIHVALPVVVPLVRSTLTTFW